MKTGKLRRHNRWEIVHSEIYQAITQGMKIIAKHNVAPSLLIASPNTKRSMVRLNMFGWSKHKKRFWLRSDGGSVAGGGALTPNPQVYGVEVVL